MDETKKVGKVTLHGDSTYGIEIKYVKENHSANCAWCKILRSRETVSEHHGIRETANALNIMLEYFKYDIQYSEMYSHCRIIRVAVFQRNGSEMQCIEEYEIRKEK